MSTIAPFKMSELGCRNVLGMTRAATRLPSVTLIKDMLLSLFCHVVDGLSMESTYPEAIAAAELAGDENLARAFEALAMRIVRLSIPGDPLLEKITDAGLVSSFDFMRVPALGVAIVDGPTLADVLFKWSFTLSGMDDVAMQEYGRTLDGCGRDIRMCERLHYGEIHARLRAVASLAAIRRVSPDGMFETIVDDYTAMLGATRI